MYRVRLVRRIDFHEKGNVFMIRGIENKALYDFDTSSRNTFNKPKFKYFDGIVRGMFSALQDGNLRDSSVVDCDTVTRNGVKFASAFDKVRSKTVGGGKVGKPTSKPGPTPSKPTGDKPAGGPCNCLADGLSISDARALLQMPPQDEEGGDGGGEEPEEEGGEEGPSVDENFTPEKFNDILSGAATEGSCSEFMEVIEDQIFDRNTSTYKYDIKYLRFYVIEGIQQRTFPVLCVRYNENSRRVLNMIMAYNRKNEAEQRSMLQVFDLHQYRSFITFMNDNSSKGLYEAEIRRKQLVKFEHTLWSY